MQPPFSQFSWPSSIAVITAEIEEEISWVLEYCVGQWADFKSKRLRTTVLVENVHS